MTRFAARLLDAGILLLLNVVINGYFAVMWWREARPWFDEVMARAQAGQSTLDAAPTERLAWISLAILVVATLIWFAYEVPSTANTGRTLGKQIMRIQVIPTEGEGQLTMGRSFRRWNPMGMSLLTLFCCWPLAFVFPILDVIFVATDRYLHQALHDRSARTYVVNALPKAPESKKEVPS